MAKTQPRGEIEIPGVGTFAANAVPDPFDARDLEYRPKLEPLPRTVDQRAANVTRRVMRQDGLSCTGHALAAVIEAVLAQSDGRRNRPRVATAEAPPGSARTCSTASRAGTTNSPASSTPAPRSGVRSRAGSTTAWGSSANGRSSRWTREPDLDDQANLLAWRERPLGAFYRVNPYRLDDVQSAITELYAIAASAAIHDGWKQPAIVKKGRRTLYVIQRPVTARGLGGHAFAVVGYNEVGFLVQNSWGPDWGNGGFATLPYDDWFDSVYDAWVARPGVPQTPFYRGRTRTSVATGGELATGAGPRPAAAGDARRQPRQRGPPLVHGQVREHAAPARPDGRAHGRMARLLAGAASGDAAQRRPVRARRRRHRDARGSRSPSASSTGG